MDNPIVNPSVVLREEFDDWAVLFEPDSGEGFAIDPVGVFIWKRLDGSNTTQDIVTQLAKECQGVPQEAQVHCKKFINDLIERGLAGYEVKGQIIS
jgi:SynChlorMet cassette protein ScmD